MQTEHEKPAPMPLGTGPVEGDLNMTSPINDPTAPAQNVDQDEDDPTPAMPVTDPASRPKSPIVHGSYEKADSDEEEVMVKTEFVWADGAEFDVKLSGAWNGWMPVQMYHEGGKLKSPRVPTYFILASSLVLVRLHSNTSISRFNLTRIQFLGGMWSVVTPVPAGTHEFKFVVDGEWKHSTRHPTVGEDDETMNNIRVIRGPPKNKQNTARLSEQRNKDAGVTTTKQKKCCIVS